MLRFIFCCFSGSRGILLIVFLLGTVCLHTKNCEKTFGSGTSFGKELFYGF